MHHLNPFKGSIHLFIWLSFILASIIYCFRVTNLKTLLFTIISSGILSILVTLIIVFFDYLFKLKSSDEASFAMYFSFIIGTLVIIVPIIFLRKVHKIISGVCINMTLIGFVGYVFLIMGLISFHQQNLCDYKYPSHTWSEKKELCFILLNELGMYTSYILLAIGLIFNYFYGHLIKYWRSIPNK